jgi:ribonuclease HI
MLPLLTPVSVAHDLWQGWGASIPSQTAQVYTDGSYAASANPDSSSSSLAVVIEDDWLHANYGSIPTDEQLLRPWHLSGATGLICASISCTRGGYAAELQAIARALAIFLLSFHLHIHSDSQASLAAIHSFQQQSNERKRMRMSARPLLQLISSLIARRQAAGGSISFSHVRAHTAGSDLRSVGNRLTDHQANLCRSKPERSYPLTLQQLPLHLCEHRLHLRDERGSGLQIIDDVRRVSLSQLQQQALAKWKGKPWPQNYCASPGVVELGRICMRYAPSTIQSTFLHVATNSIHFHWVESPTAPDRLQPLSCAACSEPLSLLHLLSCPSSTSTAFRQKLQRSILRLLAEDAPTRDWSQTHGHLPLLPLLEQLFPFSTTSSSSSSTLPFHSSD